MSYDHLDEQGYERDKNDNINSEEEVNRGVDEGDFKRFDCDKFVYNVKTGEEFWADGTKR